MKKRILFIILILVINCYQLLAQVLCNFVQPYNCPSQTITWTVYDPGNSWTLLTYTVDNGYFTDFGTDCHEVKLTPGEAMPDIQTKTLESMPAIGCSLSGPTFTYYLKITPIPTSSHRVHVNCAYTYANTNFNWSETNNYYIRFVPTPTGFQNSQNGVLFIPCGQTSLTLTTYDFEHHFLWCYDMDYNVSDYHWSMPNDFTAPGTTSKQGDNGRHTSNTFTFRL